MTVFISNYNLDSMPNIDVTGSATATAATATATLPAVANKTNVLTGFDISWNAAVTTAGVVTVTGVGSGTFTYEIPVNQTAPFIIQFGHSPLLGTATNQAISVACTTLGASVTAAVNVYGFQI